jgi:hypothetical protein
MTEKKKYTAEELQKLLPTKKALITDEIADIINKSQSEPEFQGESLLQSAITYENVLRGARVGIKEYLNAIRFCAYLVSMDDNYTEAFKKTFWERSFVQERLGLSTDDPRYNELTSAASRYRKSKLVTDILTVSAVPFHLMFAGMRYKAVGVLAELMMTAKYDRDKINAAKELLVATKNEDTKVALELGPSQQAVTMQQQLNAQLAELAMNQKKLLEAGLDLREVQKTGIRLNTIDVEVVNE